MEAYQQLEQEWAKFNDLDPAGMVACASGTAALHLAFEALQLPPGSRVLCPDFTMIACPRAITMAGLTPVFVDCNERLLMDNRLLSAAGVHFTLLVVHVYGRWAYGGDGASHLLDYRRRMGAKVVEDLAEAHGIRPHSLTDAACWSFYRNKIVAGEEGGAVWFRDPEHAELARSLRCLGFTDKHDFRHVPRGWNHRLSNANAGLVLRSLEWYQANLAERRTLEDWYNDHCPDEWGMPPRDAPWVYDLRIPGLTTEQQDRVVETVQKWGLAARHGFKSCWRQEEYRSYRRVHNEHAGASAECGWSRADWASQEVIYLPLTPGAVKRAQCRDVFDVIKSCL